MKGWKGFEVHARNSLHCYEQTIKGDSGKSSEGEESSRESLSLLQEYLRNPYQNVGRNMDYKRHSDEVSDGNEHVIENWRKGDPCYNVSNNLIELCPCSSVLWKTELASNEVEYLAEVFLSKASKMWLGSF